MEWDPGALASEYAERFATSRALAARARRVLPGGITHDARHLEPFPIAAARAQGPHKWTVDGTRLTDYGMGHGALILGHGDPGVRAAIVAQLDSGTHFSAGHELEVAWAEMVCRLIPGAELVRFTSSGTEATMLAARLARAATGRPRLLKLEGHFHGWHDEALVGSKVPFDRPPSAGLAPGVGAGVAVLGADLGALEGALAGGDAAALILEPTGASWASVPLPEGFLAGVRELTRAAGTLLIFDEVVSGFRLAPGGAQERFGVMPDLTTLGKILAGGLPGGAVAGGRDLLSLLTFDDRPASAARVVQQGTFNGNPISAAAGLAVLGRLADGALQARVDALADRLRAGLNDAFREADVAGCAYGLGSLFHLDVGADGPLRVEGGEVRGDASRSGAAARLLTGSPAFPALRRALALEGVDLLRNGGFVSITHDETVIDETVAAMRAALARLGPRRVRGG